MPLLGCREYESLSTAGRCFIHEKIVIDEARGFSIINLKRHSGTPGQDLQQNALFCVCVPLIQCPDKDDVAMTCVLVGVEMLQCSKELKHMESAVPSLSTVCTQNDPEHVQLIIFYW